MERPPELPARANLEHLRNQAKQRLRRLRETDPSASLSDAQLDVARGYGFASWRQLKTAVDERRRASVFAAARAGDVAGVSRALAAGFDPGATDEAGRTLHQIAKQLGHEAIELLAREWLERDDRPGPVKHAVDAIHRAADAGRARELAALLDAHPELLDARGVDLARRTALHRAAAANRLDCVRLLLDRGATVAIRDHADNASPLHAAAQRADLSIVRLLVEAGADPRGDGDDHELGVLGWATCLGRVREDVADYLLAAGAPMTLWAAIALDRADAVEALVRGDRSLLSARMSRSEHRRSPLHHAAAMRHSRMVRLLIDLGADVHATDAAGGTAIATAALEGAAPGIVAMLEAAGAAVDLRTALALERYDVAARLLADDPRRIGPDGADTIALHVLVARRRAAAVQWLIAHGVDVDARRVLWDCNCTALHVTAEHGLVALAALLLDAGADPTIRDDKYGATALEWARYCDRPEIAALLRQRATTQ